MAFVEKEQARQVKVEVVGSKPKELPPKQETTTIVRMRTVTIYPRRRRGFVDWLINW
jgi:hypothetical protein